jgi:hypothetical protein
MFSPGFIKVKIPLPFKIHYSPGFHRVLFLAIITMITPDIINICVFNGNCGGIRNWSTIPYVPPFLRQRLLDFSKFTTTLSYRIMRQMVPLHLSHYLIGFCQATPSKLRCLVLHEGGGSGWRIFFEGLLSVE